MNLMLSSERLPDHRQSWMWRPRLPCRHAVAAAIARRSVPCGASETATQRALARAATWRPGPLCLFAAGGALGHSVDPEHRGSPGALLDRIYIRELARSLESRAVQLSFDTDMDLTNRSLVMRPPARALATARGTVPNDPSDASAGDEVLRELTARRSSDARAVQTALARCDVSDPLVAAPVCLLVSAAGFHVSASRSTISRGRPPHHWVSPVARLRSRPGWRTREMLWEILQERPPGRGPEQGRDHAGSAERERDGRVAAPAETGRPR